MVLINIKHCIINLNKVKKHYIVGSTINKQKSAYLWAQILQLYFYGKGI